MQEQLPRRSVTRRFPLRCVGLRYANPTYASPSGEGASPQRIRRFNTPIKYAISSTHSGERREQVIKFRFNHLIAFTDPRFQSRSVQYCDATPTATNQSS